LTWKLTFLGKGPIAGATLTVTSRNGVLLLAFLTLFVTWTGGQLWALICYGIHQWRATPDPRNALHHQQQVLLRLGLSDVGFLWRLLRTTWTWKRNKSPMIFWQQAPLIAFAIVHCAVFALASVFISQVAESNAEVVLTSPVCGWSNISIPRIVEQKLEASPAGDAFYVSARLLYNTAREYTRNCYELSGMSPSLGCNILMKPTLNSKVNTTDSCPFEDRVCETAAMTLDTGFLDSNDDLGINAPPHNRIQFRKVLSCAPLPAERDYSTPWTTNSTPPVFPWEANSAGSDVLWKYYNLGPASVMGFERESTFAIINATTTYEKFYNMLYVHSH
jgi:hypothetical protein